MMRMLYCKRPIIAMVAACFIAQNAHADLLPWLSDPLNAEGKIAPYVTNSKLKPVSCPAIPDISRHPLTLQEVVTVSLCNNPDTRTAYLSLLSQADSYAQSYADYFPTITASATAERDKTFSPNSKSISRVSGISASMTIYDFGQRELGVELAELTLLTAGHSYHATLQSAISAAVFGYYNLLTAQKSVVVAEESENFAKASFEAANLRYEVGQVALADKLQAKSSYSGAKLSTQQAYNQLAQSKAAVARLMGLSPDESISVAELDDNTLALEPFGGKFAELVANAKENRVDLIAQRTAVESAKTSLKKTERANLATLSAGVSAGTSEDGIFRGSTAHSNSIGLTLSIPIFTGFTQTYNRRSAETAVESAKESLTRSELGVEQDVWNAWHSYQIAQQSWEVSLDLLDSATAFKDVSLGRYKEGIGTILDVLSAQTQYRSALQSQLQARYNLLTTRINLVQAVGVLDLETMRPENTLPFQPSPETPTIDKPVSSQPIVFDPMLDLPIREQTPITTEPKTP